MRKHCVGVIAVVVLSMLAFHLPACGQGTTQYIYDANGRLTGVIAPTGDAAIYRYDPAGNLTSIERIGAGDFAILAFSPQVGTIGDQVTLTGVGLNTATSVSFNGTPGQIVSATPASLTATVPDGASTGLITLSGARGTAATATAFTVVARVQIAPGLATILPGENVGFVATVVGTPDQRVTWAVNGIVGGSAAPGTINATGFYTAPDINNALTVTVTATSQADTNVIGQATVRILNPNFVSKVQSPNLSVGLGLTQGISASQIAVQFGGQPGTQSMPVSVTKGSFLSVQGPGVSVALGNATTISASPVAVDLGAPFAVSGAAVSADTGPVIASITPSVVTRGTITTVTITGQNLSGTSGISFNTPSGALERNIGVTNLSVSADGTTLTFTATTGPAAAVTTDVVYVSTPNGRSVTTSTGTNILRIQ